MDFKTFMKRKKEQSLPRLKELLPTDSLDMVAFLLLCIIVVMTTLRSFGFIS